MGCLGPPSIPCPPGLSRGSPHSPSTCCRASLRPPRSKAASRSLCGAAPVWHCLGSPPWGNRWTYGLCRTIVGEGPWHRPPQTGSAAGASKNWQGQGAESWSWCQDWQRPERTASLGLPRLGGRGGGCSKRQLGQGQRRLGTLCVAAMVPGTSRGKWSQLPAAQGHTSRPVGAAGSFPGQQVSTPKGQGWHQACYPLPAFCSQLLYSEPFPLHFLFTQGGAGSGGRKWGEACRGDPLNKRN